MSGWHDPNLLVDVWDDQRDDDRHDRLRELEDEIAGEMEDA